MSANPADLASTVKTVLKGKITEISREKFNETVRTIQSESEVLTVDRNGNPVKYAPNTTSYYGERLPVCRVNDELCSDLFVVARHQPDTAQSIQYFPLDEIDYASPITEITA